jgi:hypothetical protein
MSAGRSSGVDAGGGSFLLSAGDAVNGFGGGFQLIAGDGAQEGGNITLLTGTEIGGTGGRNGKIIMAGNGVVLPTLTTVQRDAIIVVSVGTVIINTTTGNMQWFDGTTWLNL